MPIQPFDKKEKLYVVALDKDEYDIGQGIIALNRKNPQKLNEALKTIFKPNIKLEVLDLLNKAEHLVTLDLNVREKFLATQFPEFNAKDASYLMVMQEGRPPVALIGLQNEQGNFAVKRMQDFTNLIEGKPNNIYQVNATISLKEWDGTSKHLAALVQSSDVQEQIHHVMDSEISLKNGMSPREAAQTQVMEYLKPLPTPQLAQPIRPSPIIR